MFKKTISLTEASRDRDLWSSITNKDAVQVIQKDSDPKVVINQEYFFHLLAAARIAFPSEDPPIPAPSLEEMRVRMKEVSRRNHEALLADTDYDNSKN